MIGWIKSGKLENKNLLNMKANKSKTVKRNCMDKELEVSRTGCNWTENWNCTDLLVIFLLVKKVQKITSPDELMK